MRRYRSPRRSDGRRGSGAPRPRRRGAPSRMVQRRARTSLSRAIVPSDRSTPRMRVSASPISRAASGRASGSTRTVVVSPAAEAWRPSVERRGTVLETLGIQCPRFQGLHEMSRPNSMRHQPIPNGSSSTSMATAISRRSRKRAGATHAALRRHRKIRSEPPHAEGLLDKAMELNCQPLGRPSRGPRS